MFRWSLNACKQGCCLKLEPSAFLTYQSKTTIIQRSVEYVQKYFSAWLVVPLPDTRTTVGRSARKKRVPRSGGHKNGDCASRLSDLTSLPPGMIPTAEQS